MYLYYLETPIGYLRIASDQQAVTAVHLSDEGQDFSKNSPRLAPDETCWAMKAGFQLREYFSGTRRDFNLPINPQGTPFQKLIWKQLLTIPYGETRTYGEIARATGNPKAARAVGMASHHNPLAIIVPCHRVIGSNGKLTGYAGGLEVKGRLLELESQKQSPLRQL